MIDSLPFLSVKEKQETNESSNDDDDEDELRWVKMKLWWIMMMENG